eukprot:TRINITY_DN7761_c0_g1_i1.p1 TRINITY_DN7761_c0_g1~~TRINITY_DN7761_c0_g1_i1.p1  ORF type:complete len:268 (-),score=30.98 TRINITY_DN7761_c0_g1_i1:790-1593(-)
MVQNGKIFFFFFKQKTAYEIMPSLVGSEMCIRDRQYQDEEYTFQLDSHHRFVQNWDEECIEMIKYLQFKGHEKPLLTGYISSFDPDNDPYGRNMIPWKMNFDRFIPEGAIFFLPVAIDNWKELTEPIPSRFYSAHFCFTLGQFVKEVPHDLNIIFTVRKYQQQQGHILGVMIYFIHINQLLGMNILERVELNNGMMTLNGQQEIIIVIKKIDNYLEWMVKFEIKILVFMISVKYEHYMIMKNMLEFLLVKGQSLNIRQIIIIHLILK